MFLDLGKVPLSNIDTENNLDGEGWLSKYWFKFPFYKLCKKNVANKIIIVAHEQTECLTTLR